MAVMAHKVCPKSNVRSFFDQQYSYLYLKHNFEALDELRAGFISEEHVSISLNVTLQVVNLTDADCDNCERASYLVV